MRKSFVERPKYETLTSRVRSILNGILIGTSYGIATMLGIVGAQRSAAPNFPLPEKVVLGLFIGIAMWAALAGLSVSTAYSSKLSAVKHRAGIAWIWISFITSTVIPLLYFFLQNGNVVLNPLPYYLKLLLFSSLSFGLSGAIIGLSAVLLQHFFWRFLTGQKWGISLACALGFFIGLSAGWAAYGWTVFSSQALFSLNFLL